MNSDLLRIRRMKAQETANYLQVAVYFDIEHDVIRQCGAGERFDPERRPPEANNETDITNPRI